MLADRTLLFICLALAVCSCTAEAQTSNPSGSELSRQRRQEIGRTVLSLLREAHIEQALKSLESVADEATQIAFFDEDGLSSACAGLHRAMSQLSSDAQFDLLSKWAMPIDAPQRVRVITAIVPTIAPPAEFARALGERPRKNSFEVSAISHVDGIFDSGWSLVRAARDSGRLKQLITKLGPLAETKVPGVERLLAMAQIADGRGDMGKVSEQLAQRINHLKAPQTGERPKSIDSANVVLALAALDHPTLRPLGEELLKILLTSTDGQPASRIRPFLQRAYASAILFNQDKRGDSRLTPGWSQKLKYWVPVSDSPAGSNSPASSNSLWLAQDDHLLHLSGSGKDSLLLRYPLTGEFQFQCEVQAEEQIESDGGLAFGGFDFYALGRKRECWVTDLDKRIIGRYYCPFVRESSKQSFNRLSLTSTPGSSTMAVNLHPMWNEKTGFAAKPWVGLSCSDEFRPLFRNLKLTGQPVIPRSVQIFNGRELRGWQMQVFGENTGAKGTDRPVWAVLKEILHVSKSEARTPANSVEQLLAYQRPILENEAVSFEFFYEPGVRSVSPLLGRVAFLLQPDGIRVHWVTDGSRDWTGLAIDHAVSEPLNRRGPRPLPLKSNAWNQLTLTRTELTVTLTLNGVVVYERAVDWSGDYRFGLYRNREAQQVRNIKLTGDWPMTLPAEFIDNPTALSDDSVSDVDRHALNRLMNEDFLAANVSAIRRKGFLLSVADRFEVLSRWVLPGPDHPGFRLTGEFTQMLPAPGALEPGVKHPELGGQVVSPVFDWIDAAKELGRLTECRQKVAQASIPDTDFQKRAKASLLLLLSLEQGDQVSATSDFESLMPLLKKQTPTGVEDQWPETLVAVRGGQLFANNANVGEVIAALYWNRAAVGRPPNVELWRTQIFASYADWQLKKQTRSDDSQTTSMALKDWIPSVAARSDTSGSGYPVPMWSRQNDSAFKHSGHLEDYLYYRLPLSGNFEVECNHVLPGQNHSLIMVAGKSLGLDGNFKNVLVGSLGNGLVREPLDPPFDVQGKTARYRFAMRDGTCSVYINGRLVQSNAFQKPFDPWIAIRSWSSHQSQIQDLRISGRPEVLSEVPLSASKDLTGWMDYYKESTTGEGGRWTHADDTESSGWIVGPRDTRASGVFKESLLRYQRPLQDDDSIEYDFYYEPEKIETNPALDRLSLILHPSGIREHWLTDARYDRTELSPDNVIDDTQCRRGPAALSLKSGEWNHLKLTLHQGALAVELNQQLVYERKIDWANQWSFGLFHYSDATESLVRNAVIRGNWSKVLPPTSEQELASQSTDSIDAGLPRLKSVFIHDFRKDGLPEKYFRFPANSSTVKITPTAEGIEVNQMGPENSLPADISPHFALFGDFDVEVKFSQLKVEGSNRNSGIFFGALFDEPSKPLYALNRLFVLPSRSMLFASRTVALPSGGRSWLAKETDCESSSGRFRLARHQDNVFYLFADGESENFHLLDTQKATEAGIARNELLLRSESIGTGRSRVVWENLTLRAERMVWYPVLDPSRLESVCVMQADGKSLRVIARPANVGFTTVGFPEWSPDSRKIVMEMSKGSTATSHVFVVNADGSQLVDLGTGCVPSFSQDGSKLVFSQPTKGVMTMNADGTNRQVIDAEGWGSQWSPDGKWIAYGKAGNITLLNVESRKTRQLLVEENATQYDYIYAGLGWSHDSRSIAFKARNRDVIQDEMVIAELDPANKMKVLHADASNISPDCSFSADDQKVLVSIENPETQALQLHGINRKQPDQIQRLSQQPEGHRVTGCALSADGKMIVLTGKSEGEPWEDIK